MECSRLDRGIRVQEGSKNSRSERGKKSKKKGNSNRLMVGRKGRERKREKGENTKYEKGLFKVYFDLSLYKNQSISLFFLNHLLHLLSEVKKTSCLSIQVKIYLWFIGWHGKDLSHWFGFAFLFQCVLQASQYLFFFSFPHCLMPEVFNIQ